MDRAAGSLYLLLLLMTAPGPAMAKEKKSQTASCIDAINAIDAVTKAYGNSGACLDCNPVVEHCSKRCQDLINDLFTKCNGVTLPDGLYYDPSHLNSGQWDAKVVSKLTQQAQRCGCNPGASLRSSLWVWAVPALIVLIMITS